MDLDFAGGPFLFIDDGGEKARGTAENEDAL